jgi:2'-5' RNA ligase
MTLLFSYTALMGCTYENLTAKNPIKRGYDMKYKIVIFPKKELQDFANSYRKRYDPHYALIPPHLTLKSPFETTEKEGKALADKLHPLAKTFNPFEINVSKFSSFKPVNNIIYLKVNPANELKELNKAIESFFITDKHDYSFVPHITIGQNLSSDEHSDIYGSLRMQNIHHIEVVDRFHLLYQLENQSWTVYETFRLGKES